MIKLHTFENNISIIEDLNTENHIQDSIALLNRTIYKLLIHSVVILIDLVIQLIFIQNFFSFFYILCQTVHRKSRNVLV